MPIYNPRSIFTTSDKHMQFTRWTHLGNNNLLVVLYHHLSGCPASPTSNFKCRATKLGHVPNLSNSTLCTIGTICQDYLFVACILFVFKATKKITPKPMQGTSYGNDSPQSTTCKCVYIIYRTLTFVYAW